MAHPVHGNASGIRTDAPPHDGTKAAAGLATFLVAVLVVAAVAAIVVWARSDQKRVSIVGDSITFFAGADETAALGSAYRVEAHAGIGKRIDEMLPAVQKAARSHPFAIVVNLGTNDARQASSHPDWQTAFDRMIATLSDQHCVVLTTINTLMSGEPGVTNVAGDINAAEVGAVAAHPNFHLVDWNAALHASNGSHLLQPDGVHPSEAGQLALAALVRNVVHHDCT